MSWRGIFSCLQVVFLPLYLSLFIYSEFGDLSFYYKLYLLYHYVKIATLYSFMEALLELFSWLHHRHGNFSSLLFPHSSGYPESWKINQNLLLQEAREMMKTHVSITILIINVT